MRTARAWSGWLVCVLALASAARAAPAQDDSIALAAYHHTPWSVKDGAPVDIWALAQAPNGELWLGTGAGLYRFDGARFLRHPLRTGERLASSNITALSVTGRDEAWIGYHAAGVSRLTPSGIRHFAHDQGLPRGMVFRFETGADGIVWAAVDEGLARFDGVAWQRVGSEWGYDGAHADWVLRDRRGRLWVSDGRQVLWLPPGGARFVAAGVPTARYAVIAEDGEGRIWLSDSLGGTRVIDAGEAAPRAPVALEAKRLLFANDGTLWATDSAHGGVVHLPAEAEPAHLDRLGRDQGLTADMAVPMLQDREGNLWVGTNLGLNRFRRNDVVEVRGLRAVTRAHFAAFVAGDGSARLVNGGKLFHADRHRLSELGGDWPLVTAAVTGRDRQTWVVGANSLWPLRGTALGDPVVLPSGVLAAQLAAVAADDAGGLWAAMGTLGVFRLHDGAWERLPVETAQSPQVLASDGEGTLWMGFGDRRVLRWRNGELASFEQGQGLDVGGITAIHAEGDDVLVAGEEGLARWQDGRFQSLTTAQAAPLVNVTGIVHAASGDWWLNGSAGLARISDAQLRRALDEPGYLPTLRVFDLQDGLPGVALQARQAPTLTQDRDGVLWIATNQGIAWIDPARVQRNRVVPDVWIQALASGEQTFATAPAPQLPAGTTQLRIDYTAASLTVPERMRFRYRLLGADRDWQDAGNRRVAFYTNLGPGDYTFQVLAANNDGVWNPSGDTLAFGIQPTFVQSRSFIVACVASGLLLLWILHLLRVRRASLRVRERLETRHQERERIARDLHDTLLQGFQGLLLRLQSVADELPPAAATRQRLDQALDRAELALEEGRDRVSGLRGENLSDESLAEVLLAVGSDYAAAATPPVRFHVLVEGEPLPLPSDLRDELCLIGREALVNAFQHAGAREVTVRIRHEAGGLQLHVIDDGVGIAPALLAAGGRDRHWGLSGMHERAERIGAKLQLQAAPGGGTVVQLILPAHALGGDQPRLGLGDRLRRIWQQGL